MPETDGSQPQRPLIQWVILPKPTNPDIDRTLRVNETTIAHNVILQSTSIEISDNENDPLARPFQLWVTDELKPKLTPALYRNIRTVIAKDISDIEKDPYGSRSIDPDRLEDEAQERRAVNRASPELEQAFGVGPLCIKSDAKNTYLGNPDRENLWFQFETMRKLALQNTAMHASMMKQVGEAPLRFAQVYMALSYPIVKIATPEKNWANTRDIRQFLFLEFIPEAQRVNQILLNKIKLKLSFGGRPNYGEPTEAFKAADHPRLKNLLKINPYRDDDFDEFIEFEKLQEALQDEYDVHGITDIAARNLLWTPNAQGEKEYIVIDQRYPYNIT